MSPELSQITMCVYLCSPTLDGGEGRKRVEEGKGGRVGTWRREGGQVMVMVLKVYVCIGVGGDAVWGGVCVGGGGGVCVRVSVCPKGKGGEGREEEGEGRLGVRKPMENVHYS